VLGLDKVKDFRNELLNLVVERPYGDWFVWTKVPRVSEITLARKLTKSQIDAELFGYAIQNQRAKSGYPNSSSLNYKPERLTTIRKNETICY